MYSQYGRSVVNVWLERDLKPGALDKVIENEKFEDEINIYAPNGEYVYKVEGEVSKEVKKAIDEYEKIIHKNGYNGQGQSDFNVERDYWVYISMEEFIASNGIEVLAYLVHDDE